MWISRGKCGNLGFGDNFGVKRLARR